MHTGSPARAYAITSAAYPVRADFGMESSIRNMQQAPPSGTAPASRMNSSIETCQGTWEMGRESLMAVMVPRRPRVPLRADEELLLQAAQRRPALLGRASSAAAPLHQGVDRGQQLGDSDRLAQRADPAGSGLWIVERPRDEADGNRLAFRGIEDRVGEADSMHVGEEAVDQGGGDAALGMQNLQRFLAGPNRHWHVPSALECPTEEAANGPVVLDYEDTRCGNRAHRRSG